MSKIWILIFLFLSIFSCSDKESILVQDMEDLVLGLDPSFNFGVAEKQVYSQIYESLVTLNDDWKTIIPKLAEKWEISENKLNYIFYLRKNVYFHDGNQMSAEDVKDSFVWQLKNDYFDQLSSVIREIKILDQYTITIHLIKPYPIFLYEIASPSGILIISKQAIRKYNTQLSHHPVGTGPFKLESLDSEREIELDAFQKYWKKKSNINKIKFVQYSDMSLLQKDLQVGKLDIIFQVPGHIIDRLKWSGHINYIVQKPVSLFYIGFNNKNRILHNIKLRKAILRAINIPQLVLNVNRGNAIVSKGPLPPVYFNYNDIEQDSYNISDAKQLMKEAGYKDGLLLNFCIPNQSFTRLTLIEFIKEYLSRIGITLNIIETNSWAEHDSVVQRDDIHLFFDGGKYRTLGDVHGFLYSLFHSNSTGNLIQYNNSQIDHWLDSLENELNTNKKAQTINKIVKQILDDTPALFLYHVKPHFAYNSKKIKKLPVNPYGIIQYQNVILNDNY